MHNSTGRNSTEKMSYRVHADDTLLDMAYKPNNTDTLHKIINNIQFWWPPCYTGHEQSRRFNASWPGAIYMHRDFLWSFSQHRIFASLISVLISPVAHICIITIDPSPVTKIVVAHQHLLFAHSYMWRITIPYHFMYYAENSMRNC